jgi:hypothetical protein
MKDQSIEVDFCVAKQVLMKNEALQQQQQKQWKK